MRSMTGLNHRYALVISLLLMATVTAVITSTVVSRGQTPEPTAIDPAVEPIPVLESDRGAKSIIIRVFFNSPTDVEFTSGAVSKAPAPAHVGGPPLIQVEVLDGSGDLVEEYNDWHPLWTEIHGDHDDGNGGEHDEDGNGGGHHAMVIAESGEGRFIIGYAPEIVSVKISDIELGQDLVEVDARRIIVDYCADKRDDPDCAGVPCPGDVDGDGRITVADIMAIGRAMHSTPDSPRWNPDADVNGDHVVGMTDLLIAVNSFTDPDCR